MGWVRNDKRYSETPFWEYRASGEQKGFLRQVLLLQDSQYLRKMQSLTKALGLGKSCFLKLFHFLSLSTYVVFICKYMIFDSAFVGLF